MFWIGSFRIQFFPHLGFVSFLILIGWPRFETGIQSLLWFPILVGLQANPSWIFSWSRFHVHLLLSLSTICNQFFEGTDIVHTIFIYSNKPTVFCLFLVFLYVCYCRATICRSEQSWYSCQTRTISVVSFQMKQVSNLLRYQPWMLHAWFKWDVWDDNQRKSDLCCMQMDVYLHLYR